MTYEEALALQQAKRGGGSQPGAPKASSWRPTSILTGKALWGRPDVYGDQVIFMAGIRVPRPNGENGSTWAGYGVIAIRENGVVTGDPYTATVALIPSASLVTKRAANDG